MLLSVINHGHDTCRNLEVIYNDQDNHQVDIIVVS